MGRPLVIALDGARVVTQPTAQQFSLWAYAAHAEACPICTGPGGWCPTGRDLLSASRSTDLPGYGQSALGFPAV